MRQVRTLGLLGTGVIGGGWAARALHFGIDVLAADLKPEMEEWIRGHQNLLNIYWFVLCIEFYLRAWDGGRRDAVLAGVFFVLALLTLVSSAYAQDKSAEVAQKLAGFDAFMEKTLKDWNAPGIGVGIASVEEIDTVNIYHAGLLAMRRAVEALPRRPQHVLVDARTVPGVEVPQNTFNKGDGINFTIAAASIIAKTERDRMMAALALEFPGYGFSQHKGYGTAEHREALQRLGPSPAHRMSFPVIHELRGEYSPLFYVLKDQLEVARTRAALDELEAALRAQADELAERECKKLRLLATRRWKLIC